MLNANAAIKSAEIEELSAQRRRLEVTANQLNPKSLDPDMVDEKVRSVLGFVAEGDVVVPRDQLDQMLAAARGKMSATGAR